MNAFSDARGAMRPWLMASAALVTLLAPGTAAMAADAPTPTVGVEELIVTAEKRPENIQDVPMSVSAFSGDTLAKNNIANIADLSRFTPSVSIQSSTNNRNSSITMRNVGTSGTNPGTDQDVGVFIDGVYVQVAGPVYSELTDISTVEILRGPQGTLYGRNTPVGAINVTTKAPTSQFEASNILQAGNFGRWKVSGVVGGGIADNLAGRISYWEDKSSGDIKNIYNGEWVDADLKEGIRGRLRWTPDDKTSVDLIAYYSHTRTNGSNATQVNPLGPGGIVFGYNPAPASFAASPFVIAQLATNPGHPYVVPGKFQTDSADGAGDVTNMYGISAEATRELPQINANVTDILAYASYYDHAPNQAPGSLPLDLATNEQIDQIYSTSNELRIASDKKQLIDYVAGLYYYHSNLTYQAITTSGTQGNRLFPAATGGGGRIPFGNRQTLIYHQPIDSIAAFGQATWNVTDRLRLTAGGRYSDDRKTGSINAALSNITGAAVSPVFIATSGGGGSLSAKRDDKGKTWTLGAQYDVTDGVMAYVTSGSGFKDGGFNSRSAVIQPFTFNPETSITYEAGMKTTLLDHRLLLNADVFQMIVHDYQQSALLQTGTGFAIGNAGNFRNTGFELDAQAAPIAPLSITASASYIDSKITGGADRLTCDSSFPFAGSAPPATSGQFTDATHKFCNFNGLTLPYAPKWRASLNGKWEQPLGGTDMTWFVQADMSYQSSQYMDSSLDPRSFLSAYAIYDGSFGISGKDGKWRASVWGKNLTDKFYFVAEAAQTQGANISAGGTAAANGFIGWMGRPRSYGVELDYKW
ncbi:MAG: TonB-dependent receptor [Phenylobacterium sp.]